MRDQRQQRSSGTKEAFWEQCHSRGSTTTNYTYNGLGERVTKQTGSNVQHYFYNGPQLLAEYDDTGSVEREYIYLNEQPVVMLDHSGSGIDIYWIHNDHLGRPLSLTDEAGNVVWKLLSADAFGNAATIDEDPDSNSVDLAFNMRFPGQYFDQETGLSYNYQRYYDPATDRYITSDPIGLLGGLNTYIYAMANPLRFTDPEGLQTAPTVPTPFPGLPIILPPVVIPGTPENQAWVDMVNDALDAFNNLFRGSAADDIPEKCPPEKPKDCKETKNQCIASCSDSALPTSDNGFQFWNCVNQCMEDKGC